MKRRRLAFLGVLLAVIVVGVVAGPVAWDVVAYKKTTKVQVQAGEGWLQELHGADDPKVVASIQHMTMFRHRLTDRVRIVYVLWHRWTVEPTVEVTWRDELDNTTYSSDGNVVSQELYDVVTRDAVSSSFDPPLRPAQVVRFVAESRVAIEAYFADRGRELPDWWEATK